MSHLRSSVEWTIVVGSWDIQQQRFRERDSCPYNQHERCGQSWRCHYRSFSSLRTRTIANKQWWSWQRHRWHHPGVWRKMWARGFAHSYVLLRSNLGCLNTLKHLVQFSCEKISNVIKLVVWYVLYVFNFWYHGFRINFIFLCRYYENEYNYLASAERIKNRKKWLSIFMQVEVDVWTKSTNQKLVFSFEWPITGLESDRV